MRQTRAHSMLFIVNSNMIADKSPKTSQSEFVYRRKSNNNLLQIGHQKLEKSSLFVVKNLTKNWKIEFVSWKIEFVYLQKSYLSNNIVHRVCFSSKILSKILNLIKNLIKNFTKTWKIEFVYRLSSKVLSISFIVKSLTNWTILFIKYQKYYQFIVKNLTNWTILFIEF